MTRAEVQIVNRLGLHARAAAKLVQTANRYRATITVGRAGSRVNGKSILGLLTLAARRGTTLVVIAEGDDESAAVEALVGLVTDGFGEGVAS